MRRTLYPGGPCPRSLIFNKKCKKNCKWVTDYCDQYGPCKICQINACEFAANQSRLRETPLMLKLYFTDSNNLYYVIGVFSRPVERDTTVC